MSNVKHIPGPWRVFNHSWSATSILADGFDHAICLLDINHATEESQEADEALMAANARLIAAVPELLASAQAVIAWWNEWAARQPQDDTIEAAEWSEFHTLRAAIAKATGATP